MSQNTKSKITTSKEEDQILGGAAIFFTIALFMSCINSYRKFELNKRQKNFNAQEVCC